MEAAEKPKSTPEHVLIAVDPKPKQSPCPEESSFPIEDKSQVPRAASRRRVPHSNTTKARFGEFNRPASSSTRETTVSQDQQNPSAGTCDSDSDEVDGPNEQHEATSDSDQDKRRKRLLTFRAFFQWAAVVVLSAALVLSLVLPSLSHQTLWGLTVWKWCLTLLVVFCGRLFAGWVVTLVVCLVELNFMLREKVLYFIYGLRRGVQNCIWLSFVLLAWMLVFDADVKTSSPRYHRILDKITRLLIAIVVGSFIWLAKIVVVKMLALSFHVSTFFDRMKESVFHQRILDALSKKPQAKISREATMPESKPMGRSVSMPVKSVMASMTSSKRKEGKIDMERLRQLSKASASAWGIRDLVDHIMSKGLSTAVDETLEKTDKKREKEEEIRNEKEASRAARRIFDTVDTNRNKYIDEEDLLQFLKEEEVHTMLPYFEGATKTRRIERSAFENWVVKAFKERKALAHALTDTKTAVQQLHKLASCVVIVLIIVVTLLIMGVANTKVIVFISSQLLLVVFIFGNTCRTIFEAIIFVFVMHPFDVGDRVVIDGTMMIVDEMNILNTVFLRFDNEMIYYPNSVLLTKPISNYYRSPPMGDNVEFSIDFSTPETVFNDMKTEIRKYIDDNKKHWQSKHSVVVREIENMNRMKIVLYVLHTINFQDIQERNKRRSELVFGLKRIFERLEIKYHLLPQELHVTQYSIAAAAPSQI